MINGFNVNMERLGKLSCGLIDRGHFDTANIQTKMYNVEQQFDLLKQLANGRQTVLEENRKVICHKIL